jgi:hypothetical protein
MNPEEMLSASQSQTDTEFAGIMKSLRQANSYMESQQRGLGIREREK